MANKVGRPRTPKDKARSKIITLRLTQKEYDYISMAMPAAYVDNQSAWIRKVLLYVTTNGIRIT
jgi:hypothetical protein